MIPQVRVLATCRSIELLPFTLFVFRSIRTGFPTAKIKVTGNNLPNYALEQVRALCLETNCEFENGPDTIHHKFVEELLDTETNPLILCDCDIHFFESVENWDFESALAGFRVPEFFDEFTNAITRARLHPSLLFVNPAKYREAVAKYESQFPVTPFNPLINLVHPICQPFKQRAYFSDTLAFAYHAIGGTAFTDQQLDFYFHFHVGSCSDVVLPRLTNGKQETEWREKVLNNPQIGRGAWRKQLEYCENHQPVYDGVDVIAPIKPEDAVIARQWNAEMCCNDPDAMACCDLAYGLFHSVDDLLDSVEDGRPTMSKDQMIEVWLNAAIFYNCKFFNQHRDLLFPIMLDITGTWADSVVFEKSPAPHLRAIADITRMSGDRFYAMVALICGGVAHRNYVSRKITERDYLLQHSKDGYPI